MGLLSDEEKAKYYLAKGHLYEYVCDEKDCGNLIRVGEMCTVLKWVKRTDGLQSMLGRIPVKVRCSECQRRLNPPKETVKVKGVVVSKETAAGLKIDPVVRRTVLKLLQANPSGITPKDLVLKLRRRKKIREMKKGDVSATIRSMKKLKLIRKKAGVFILPPEKKVKNAVKKTKSRKTDGKEKGIAPNRNRRKRNSSRV